MTNTPSLNAKKQQKLDILMRKASTAHQQNNLATAARGYRKALKEVPHCTDALHLLGLVHYQQRDFETAVTLIKQAIALAPNNPLYSFNLGKVQKDHGQLGLAAQAFQHALQLEPGYWQAAANLGSVHMAQGHLDEAIAQFEATLRINPDDAIACNNLGTAYRQCNRSQDAENCFRRAISIASRYAEAHSNLGVLLREQGRLDDAIQHCRQATDLNPDQAELWSNLGMVEAKCHRYTQSVDCFHRALALDPHCASALTGLGNTLREQGQLPEAIDSLLQGCDAGSFDHIRFACLLCTLNYTDHLALHVIAAQHQRFGIALQTRIAKQGLKTGPPDNDYDPERRLRLGFVSPDFRTHSCACFLLPLIEHLPVEQVEIYAYAEVARPDTVTQRFRNQASHWCDTTRLSDQELAEQIRFDHIDILIDCAGHTEGNRLSAFGLRPAPLQLTWLGYPNTTGLTNMDYRLTDTFADPEEKKEADAHYTEQLLRMPRSFLCFQPLDAMPERSPLPMQRNGHVTFGCLNNFAKLTPTVLQLWAEILAVVPNSQLILKAAQLADTNLCMQVRTLFAAQNIDAARLTLCGQTPSRTEHFAFYQRIDIALDPFPYNGTTTTCEALWMGVPVITLAGDCHAARVGVSLLSHTGLERFIACDTIDYIRIARELADNSDELAQLRQRLRIALQDSALCDTAGFAQDFNTCLRRLWRKTCVRNSNQGANTNDRISL
ncbi:MAG: tetratricopeptide repeat protein [Gammaproteobacteria bacterium]|nr:tetratricopeptide repeat protein [Gammaproteobacteria bacterium]